MKMHSNKTDRPRQILPVGRKINNNKIKLQISKSIVKFSYCSHKIINEYKPMPIQLQ